MDLLSFVECATVAMTFLVIASGLPACLQMYRSRSTKGVPYVLFLVYAFVSTLCIQYGLLVKNKAVLLINVVSLMVWLGYISVYFLVTTNKLNAFMKASTILFLYWSHLQYLAIVEVDQVLPTLGFYTVFWCTVLALIPCLDIMTMVNSKKRLEGDNTLLYTTSLNAVVWTLYGILLHDINIWFPSVVTIMVNIVKFVLIQTYPESPRPTKSKAKSVKKIEEINGNIVTDFHEEVYRIKPRSSLYNGAH